MREEGQVTNDGKVGRGARHLFEVLETRSRLSPMPEALRPSDLAEAYAMQEALQALLAPARGTVAGYKIAITTPVMQRLMGIAHPCGGAVFASQLHASPAQLRCSDYIHVAVECEIAVRLGADLPGGRSYDRDSVGAAIDACMASIEVVDDQNADYKLASGL